MANPFIDSSLQGPVTPALFLHTTRPYACRDRDMPDGRLPMRVAWSIMIVVALGFWYAFVEFVIAACHFFGHL